MGKTKSNVLAKLVIAFVMMVGVFSMSALKADAKGLDEIPAEYNNQPGKIQYNESVIYIQCPYTLEGYDFGGRKVEIWSSGVIIKNCTNFSCIFTQPNLENLEISSNSSTGGYFQIDHAKNSRIENNILRDANAPTGSAIHLNACTSIRVSGNQIIDSKKSGIWLEADSSSVISNNTVKNANSSASNGMGIVVNPGSRATKVIGNTVDTVKTGANPADANGMVVSGSNMIIVQENIVKNAGYHGIQVSYEAMGITIDNNTVTNCGNEGITVSRGSSANVTNNTVKYNVGDGIVFDGSDRIYRTVTGEVSGNNSSENTEAGIHVLASEITVNANRFSKNGNAGMLVDDSSTVTVTNNTIDDNVGNANNRTEYRYGLRLINSKVTLNNNKVYMSANDANGIGIQSVNADIQMNDNKFANYGYVVITGTAASLTGDGNKISTEAAAFGSRVTFWVNERAETALTGTEVYTNKPKSELIPDERTPEQIEQIKNFVIRLYSVCLDRTPDAAGLNRWVNLLVSGQQTGATAAYGFIFSDEFKNYHYCNSDYTEYLYKAFFGRASDPAGKATWVGGLNSGAMNREFVFNGFTQSTEFRNICESYGIELGDPIAVPANGTTQGGAACSICGTVDPDTGGGSGTGIDGFVTRMFNVCLDRTPDAEGLATWTNALSSHAMTGSQVAHGFIFSPEFTGRGLSNADYVEYMYKAFFGRPSDAGGKAMWVGFLEDGSYDREAVFAGFTGSTEFGNLCAEYGITR